MESYIRKYICLLYVFIFSFTVGKQNAMGFAGMLSQEGYSMQPMDSVIPRQTQHNYSIFLGDTLQLSIKLHHVTRLEKTNGRIVVKNPKKAEMDFEWESLEDKPFVGSAINEPTFMKPGNYRLKINKIIVDTFHIKNLACKDNGGTYHACTDSLFLQLDKKGRGRWNVKEGSAAFANPLKSATYVYDLAPGLNILQWVQQEEGHEIVYEVNVYNRALRIKTKDVQHASCYNAADGKASFAIKSNAEYDLYWQGQKTNKLHFNDLTAGTYTLVARSGHCEDRKIVKVEEPRKLTLHVKHQQQPDDCKSTNGVINAGAQGGMPPYSYSYYDQQGNFQQGATATNLGMGHYIARVEDKRGCSDTATVHMKPEKLQSKNFIIKGASTVTANKPFVYEVKSKQKPSKWRIRMQTEGGRLHQIEEGKVRISWNKPGVIKAYVYTACDTLVQSKHITLRDDLVKPELPTFIISHNDNTPNVGLPSKFLDGKLRVFHKGRQVVETSDVSDWEGYNDNGEMLAKGRYYAILNNSTNNSGKFFYIVVSENKSTGRN